MRSFFFQRFDDLPKHAMLKRILENHVPLRPIFILGIFYEGLVSFHLARNMGGDEYQSRGEAALEYFRNLAEQNKWNFMNKHLLLAAEQLNTSGYHDQATELYERAIRSANEHRFISEEAAACELAGMHSYDRGLHQKSYALLLHAVKCYKKWGAFAIARRVEGVIHNNFGPGFGPIDDLVSSIFATVAPRSSRKRSE